jgi:archaellum component FlaC
MQENTPREVELNFSSNEERIEDLEANLHSYSYSLSNRTEQLQDSMRKVSGLERELEEYKQKYADEVQKRLDLINQINCNKIDKTIEEIEIAFYKMK